MEERRDEGINNYVSFSFWAILWLRLSFIHGRAIKINRTRFPAKRFASILLNFLSGDMVDKHQHNVFERRVYLERQVN